MDKIGLDIVGLSYSQTQSGAYALVLAEKEGKRRLPIIIGGFEAQAIAIELEDMTPSRPLTHDLFKSFAKSFDISIQEVIIYNLIEGVFYAKLICLQLNKTIEIDTRTSDAVALAVRFKCPIYTYEFILKDAGVLLEEEESTKEETKTKKGEKQIAQIENKLLDSLSIGELKARLKKAIASENYEEASQIRDELQKRSESNN